MAGHLVAIYLKEKGLDVTALSRRRIPLENNVLCDVFDKDRLIHIILEGKFDYIVNCIGLLNKECDRFPEQAVYLNSYLPHFVCSLINNMPTRFIQVSTDCVFSGTTGPYYENSFKDGKTFYDRTKALGEIENGRHLTFRNSIVGPDINPDGIGLFNWFMKQKGTINGFTEVYWTGITTLTLAQAIECAIEEEISGIYNLVNNSSISKYQMLIEFNEIFNKEITILKNADIVLAKTLVNTRTDFSFVVPSYHDMFLEMAVWMENHKEIYRHYYEAN